MELELDELLTALGPAGRFQISQWALIGVINCFPSIWHIAAAPTFLSEAPPDHHCLAPLSEIPLDADGRPERCVRYVNRSVSNATEKCTAWWYNTSHSVQSTIATQWNLVCDQKFVIEVCSSVFAVGIMFGAAIFGLLSDRYGRKKVMFGCLLVQSLVGIAAAFSPHVVVFSTFRFLIGALEQGVNLSGFIMSTELFVPKHRTTFAVSHEFFWAAGAMSLPLVAYFIRQWHYLQLAISAPFLLFIFFWFVVEESLPWLISKQRWAEADRVLRRIARTNGRPLPDNYLARLRAHYEESRAQAAGGDPVHVHVHAVQQRLYYNNNSTSCSPPAAAQHDTPKADEAAATAVRSAVDDAEIAEAAVVAAEDAARGQSQSTVALVADPNAPGTHLDLVRTRVMLVITICVAVLWFVNTLVYYGLLFNADNLPGDFYLNFFLNSAIEVPSVALTLFLLSTVGRKWPLLILHVICGVSTIIIPYLPQTGELKWLALLFALVAKFAVNATFTIVYVYGAELFPTTVRNIGVGFGSLWGRIGFLCLPPIRYLEKLDNRWLRDKAPLTIYGAVAVAAGLGVLPLRETRNRPLPRNVQELLDAAAHRRLFRSRGGGGSGRGEAEDGKDGPLKVTVTPPEGEGEPGIDRERDDPSQLIVNGEPRPAPGGGGGGRSEEWQQHTTAF